MKLQVAVDKLFSHKLFSNKYFLYAVVAASVLSNYMRIVDRHYEVVGFFILVGIIMMNFSKNIAVVLTVCLLLTQIIMAGKAVREGLENADANDDDKDEKWRSMPPPEQREEMKRVRAIKEKLEADIPKIDEKIKNITEKIAGSNRLLTKLKDEKQTARKANIDTREDLKNENKPNKKIKLQNKQQQTQAEYDKIAAQVTDMNKRIDKLNEELKQLIAEKERKQARIERIKKKIENIRAALVTARADRQATASTRANAKQQQSDVVKDATNKTLLRQQRQERQQLRQERQTQQKRSRFDGRNQIAGKQPFALLNENGSDMEDQNGFDFMGPSDLSGLTQGTTNLMTKQKDLFSLMNSFGPLVDNAKKILNID
jgi:hypothetical protein